MESESAPDRESGYHPESLGGLLLSAILLSASSPLPLLIAAAGCLLLAFVCALFENALQDYSGVRLKEEARRRGIDAKIDAILLREDQILFASKVGRGLFQIVGVSIFIVVLVQAQPGDLAAVGWSVLVASFFLLVNVSAPYVLGWRYGESILLRWLIPYSRAVKVLTPVALLLHKAAERLAGSAPEPDPTEEVRDDILSAVEEGRREGTLEVSEKHMIEGVIDLREVTADHIMTPRTEMVCLPIRATAQEAIESSKGRGLSRLPIYRETPDDIVGVLYVKDLLPYLGQEEMPPIEKILRKPFFIPHSKNVKDLLQEMRARRIHLAIVRDE
jgi:CBS domain containing-hemolysin-like protein